MRCGSRQLAWAPWRWPSSAPGALVRKPPDRPDIGHIPVSNLYEVFVMFCWMTALFYLYYEQQYARARWAPS
jgi:ABC-type transport system involved in cytochrome c biogenesis permease subunit